MSTRGTLDLETYQGDDFSYTLTFVDSNDAAINFGAATWAAEVREKNSPVSALKTTMTVDTAAQATGIIVLSIAKAVTETLNKNLYWDLSRTDINRTYLGGTFKVQKQITTS